MGKLEINAREYVRDAFYSIPDFTDGEGRHLGGVYGAVFKLVNTLKAESADSINVVLSEVEGLTPAVVEQTALFTEILKGAAGEGCSETETGFSIAVSDSVAAALSDKLQALSPTGQVKAAPVFTLKMRSTSDLNEVEGIFKAARDYGCKNVLNYVGYYFLTDVVAAEGGKHREILGLSICFDENEAIFVPVENFITADYLGKKLSELSKDVSLVTFDIKESFRVFEPFEISGRKYGYEYAEDGSCKDKSYKDKPRCFDTLIGAYLVNPNKNDYEPFDVAKEYLGLTLEKKTDLFGKKSVLEAQEKVVTDGYALLGVDMDTIGPEYRDVDHKGVHMTPEGLKKHGEMWAEILIPYIKGQL